MKCKAFCNHKMNGVRLEFPNGNAISTVWGTGTYSDFRDHLAYPTELIEEGSATVEITVLAAPDKLIKKIHRHLNEDSDDSVIGWVSITDWLWVINQLAKERRDETQEPSK